MMDGEGTDSRQRRVRTFLLFASHAAALADLTRAAEDLRSNGHQVLLAAVDGGLANDLVHRLRAANTPIDLHAPSKFRRITLQVAAPIVGRTRRTLLAAKFDPWFRTAARAADIVLLVDDGAAAARELVGVFNPGAEVHVGTPAGELLRQQPHWDRLLEALDAAVASGEREVPSPAAIIAALDGLASEASDRPVLWPDGVEAALVTIARRLVRRGRNKQALDLIAAASRLPGLDPVDTGLEVLRLAADLAANQRLPDGLQVAVARALGAADRALTASDIDHVVDLTTAALGLVFHRDLHADEPRSPLVDDPTGFLAPLGGTVVDALRRPLARRRAERPEGSVGHHAVVLPGAYSRFATPIIEALERTSGMTVSVLDLSVHDNAYRWLGIDPMMVELRLRRALGEDVGADPEQLAVLDRADVVFVDWADKGAVWASMFVPEGTRLVVRIHSMDALSPWLHLVDWSRVDDLIFVGAHLRDLVADQLGNRLTHIRLHVVPNVVELDRFVGTTAPGSERTLAMVGWGTRVKDPHWAIEVLAILREQDTDWRLLLIGADFDRTRVASNDDYADTFRRRVRQDDLRHHIHYVGETDDVPSYLHRAGYILSASRRESFHLGLVEGVAAGAVPVVRNWPVFAQRNGARSVYPDEWVVDTPAQAAERICGTAADRGAVAVQAQQEVRDRFDPTRARAELVRIILGASPS